MNPTDEQRLSELSCAHDLGEPYAAKGSDILLLAYTVTTLMPMIFELIETQRMLSDKIDVLMGSAAYKERTANAKKAS